MNITPTIIEKFWKRVDKTTTPTGCWNWTGTLCSKNKVPVVRFGTKSAYSARKISLILSNKNISITKMTLVMCKNNLCVNPDHLISGDEARFWSKVHKLKEEDGGCWVWTGSQTEDMYGEFGIRKQGKRIKIYAHRYSWQLANGHIIKTSLLQVCHKCDHPYCVNPDHLFLGTTQDNTKDRDNKNRQCKGENKFNAKLTDSKVQEIRELHTQGVSMAELGRRFGVTDVAIGFVVKRTKWKHVA